MGLKRFGTISLWDNEAKAAGAVTTVQDVSRVEFIGVFIEVSAATTISIQTDVGGLTKTYDTIVFPAANSQFVNIWSWPFQYIFFKTSAAVTITIRLYLKT